MLVLWGLPGHAAMTWLQDTAGLRCGPPGRRPSTGTPGHGSSCILSPPLPCQALTQTWASFVPMMNWAGSCFFLTLY